jgi:hypothetical protein
MMNQKATTADEFVELIGQRPHGVAAAHKIMSDSHERRLLLGTESLASTASKR